LQKYATFDWSVALQAIMNISKRSSSTLQIDRFDVLIGRFQVDHLECAIMPCFIEARDSGQAGGLGSG
jgi:hypothetical protein